MLKTRKVSGSKARHSRLCLSGSTKCCSFFARIARAGWLCLSLENSGRFGYQGFFKSTRDIRKS